jgi:hypothetical protein
LRTEARFFFLLFVGSGWNVGPEGQSGNFLLDRSASARDPERTLAAPPSSWPTRRGRGGERQERVFHQRGNDEDRRAFHLRDVRHSAKTHSGTSGKPQWFGAADGEKLFDDFGEQFLSQRVGA